MMKLIDALNMIAKGELEEGTKVRMGNFIYTCDNYFWWNQVSFFEDLNKEVEIIGKDTGRIKEINVEQFTEHNDTDQLRMLFDKLNEVIRELNRRSE